MIRRKDVDSEIVNQNTKLPGLDTDNSKEYETECNRDNDNNNKDSSIQVTKNHDLNKEDTKVSNNDPDDNIRNTEIEMIVDNEENEICNDCNILEEVTEDVHSDTLEEAIGDVHGDSMEDTTEELIQNPNVNNEDNDLLDRVQRMNRFNDDVMLFLNTKHRKYCIAIPWN